MTGRHDDLAQLLDVLSSPVRLQILHALRTPQSVGDIRVVAARTRKGEHEGRHLARPTVHHHVEALESAGLVARVASDDGGAGKFVIDHQRVFALVDEIRSLARLRSAVQASDGVTMISDDAVKALPDPPRLVLAYGRDDHVGYGLGDGRRWVLGRGAECEVSLDYDPYASTRHAEITRVDDAFAIRDLDSSNGTLVEGRLLRPGEQRSLASGALVQVGRSILVFQEHAP